MVHAEYTYRHTHTLCLRPLPNQARLNGFILFIRTNKSFTRFDPYYNYICGVYWCIYGASNNFQWCPFLVAHILINGTAWRVCKSAHTHTRSLRKSGTHSLLPYANKPKTIFFHFKCLRLRHQTE